MSSENQSTERLGLNPFSQISSQDKTDIRRVQGQISCAECRRLKLKCDKKIPCNSCVRRGCISLCPIKVMTPAPTKRIMTTSTVALQKKVQEMNQRIKQLENALFALNTAVSSEPHPLLAGVPRSSKIEFQKNSLPDVTKSIEMVDALGTLTLGKLGDARYLGRSAGSESLLEDSPEVLGTTDEEDSITTNELAQLVNNFPFASDNTWDVESSMKLIISFLPERERALTLAEGFLTQNFWYITIVSREELIDELLTPVYRSLSTQDVYSADSPQSPFSLSPTRVAVLFICLAHGSLADLGIPMHSVESARYFNISRASLALHPILFSPDLASVQALTLIGSYYVTGGPKYSIEAGWVYLTIAAKLTHSLGLHRESPRWGLDDKTIQRRRAIFWELYTFDRLISLELGRPPSLFVAHCDTPLPVDQDDSVDVQGNIEPGFHRWRMTFSRDVLTAVSSFTLSPRMPDYQTVLDLDRLVREHPLPLKYDPLRSLSNGLEKDSTTMTKGEEEHFGHEATLNALKGHHLTQFRAVVIMHVHRAFFAQALLQSPSDPLNSSYAPSFLAAYRIASTMVHLNVRNFYRYSETLSRYWEIWSGLLSAGITLGLIVIRSPTCTIAAKAYAELELAVDLFKLGAPISEKARRALNVLLRMYEKATKSYISTNSQGNTTLEEMNVIQEDADALHTLETFAGYTKILMKEIRSSKKSSDKNASPEPLGDAPDSGSRFPSSEKTTTHLAQGSNYSFRSFSTSPPSSSTSSASAGQSSDRISHWQNPFHHRVVPIERTTSFDYAATVSTPSDLPAAYSFERGDERLSGVSSVLGSSRSRDLPTLIPSSRYRSFTKFSTQREYAYWNENQNQLPLPVDHGGSYDTRPTWTPSDQISNPFQPGMNQERNMEHTGQAPINRPSSPYTMPVVYAQWAELMRDEGVW